MQWKRCSEDRVRTSCFLSVWNHVFLSSCFGIRVVRADSSNLAHVHAAFRGVLSAVPTVVHPSWTKLDISGKFPFAEPSNCFCWFYYCFTAENWLLHCCRKHLFQHATIRKHPAHAPEYATRQGNGGGLCHTSTYPQALSLNSINVNSI